MRARSSLLAIVLSGLLAASCGGSPEPSPVPVLKYQLVENANLVASMAREWLGLELVLRKNKDGIDLCVAADRVATAAPVLSRLGRELDLRDVAVPDAAPNDSSLVRAELRRRHDERRIETKIRQLQNRAVNVLVQLTPDREQKEHTWRHLSVVLVVPRCAGEPSLDDVKRQLRGQLMVQENMAEGAVEVELREIDMTDLRRRLASPPTPVEPVAVVQETRPDSVPVPRHLWPVYFVAVASLLANIVFVLAWWRRRGAVHSTRQPAKVR